MQKTVEQQEMFDSILQNLLTVVDAKAGTGKTTIAVEAAYRLYEKYKMPLFYVFSPVMESRIGYLPGDEHEKLGPYVQPLKDALLALGVKPITAIFDPKLPDDHITNRGAWIKPISHVYARGINLRNATVILDEAQNWTVDELKKILTRCHDDCRVVMIGHKGQIDLEDVRKSGFEPYMYHATQFEKSKKVRLTQNFRGELSQWADSLV